MRRNLACFALGVYGLLLAAVTLGKTVMTIPGLWHRSHHHVRRLELIPFGEFTTARVWWGPWFDISVNIALFLPLGLLLAIVWHGQQRVRRRVIALCALASLTIESLQYLFQLGYTDIDDLIFNTLGAFLGYLMWQRWHVSARWAIAGTVGVSLVLLGLLGLGSSDFVLSLL